MSDGKTSRFYKRLVYDDRIATQVQAGQNGREINGQFQIHASAQPGAGLEKVEAAVPKNLPVSSRTALPIPNSSGSKCSTSAAIVRGSERIGGFGGKSDRLAQGATFAGNPDQYKVALNWVRQASKADLQKVARDWLSDGVYVLEVHPYPELKPVTSSLDRSKLPDTASPADVKLPKFQRATLSNGLKVILAERHDTPLVNFWMQVKAGYAADDPARLGATKLMTAVLPGGTKTRDSLQISDDLQRLGANLDVFSNLDFTMIQLSALTAKLDGSLDLYADVLLNPTFPESEFKREQGIQLANIQQEQSRTLRHGAARLPAASLRRGPRLCHAVFRQRSHRHRGKAAPRRSREAVHHLGPAQQLRPGSRRRYHIGGPVPKLEKRFAAWKSGTVPARPIAHVDVRSSRWST